MDIILFDESASDFVAFDEGGDDIYIFAPASSGPLDLTIPLSLSGISSGNHHCYDRGVVRKIYLDSRLPKSQVIYGVTGEFKVNITAQRGPLQLSDVLHLGPAKTPITEKIVEMELLTHGFSLAALEFQYSYRGRYLRMENLDAVDDAIVQDGDTVEISTSEADALESPTLTSVDFQRVLF